jgi:hypothetical protein
MKKSYEDRLREAERRVSLLKSVEYLHKYFYPVRKSRTSYIVEMRRVVSLKLMEEGLLMIDLAAMFGKDHATILHNIKTPGLQHVVDTVIVNYEQWIADGVYPDTLYVSEYSDIHATGMATVLNYELLDVIDINRPPSTRFKSKTKI